MVLWVNLEVLLTYNVWVIEGPLGQVMMPAVDEFIKEVPMRVPHCLHLRVFLGLGE